MSTMQIQDDGTLGQIQRPRNSERHGAKAVVVTGDPNGLVALLAWRALWYGGGCDGLEDLLGYQTEHPGGLMEDAGADLAAALERIRTLDGLVGAERAERQAADDQVKRLELGLENAASLAQGKIAELAERLEDERALRRAVVEESAARVAELENERTAHAQTRGELERLRLRAQTAERALENVAEQAATERKAAAERLEAALARGNEIP
jgi:hypothetical protein